MSYFQAANACKLLGLFPSTGPPRNFTETYLLYAADRGMPITFAMLPSLRHDGHVYVGFRRQAWEVPMKVLQGCLRSAIDKSTFVSFVMKTHESWINSETEGKKDALLMGLLHLEST